MSEEKKPYLIINEEYDEIQINIKHTKPYMKLQQENIQLKDKIKVYENPEDLTLMFMYCDEKAKDKIKQLKEKLKGVQEERDYLFNKTSVENKYLQQERDKYKDVIEKANNELITLIQIIMEQPSKNVEEDNYLLSKLESISNILVGDNNE